MVEDEEQIRNLARRVLEQLGYVVLEAVDGVDGLTVYQKEQQRIAAVILDLTMPKKSGLEVLATLRRLNPAVRVILSSGYSAAAQKLDLPRLGADADPLRKAHHRGFNIHRRPCIGHLQYQLEDVASPWDLVGFH